MRKFLFFLARVFGVDLTVEKIVCKEKIVEMPVEVPVEKLVALEGVVDGDLTVKGDLGVTGNVYVSGNVSCHNEFYYGMTDEEVRVKTGGGVSAHK